MQGGGSVLIERSQFCLPSARGHPKCRRFGSQIVRGLPLASTQKCGPKCGSGRSPNFHTQL